MFTSSLKRPNATTATTLMGLAVIAGLGLFASTPSALAASNTSSGGGGQQACEEAGFMWSYSLKRCANKNCTAGGKTYGPGSTRQSGPILGMKRVYYWCDGLTGQWGTIR